MAVRIAVGASESFDAVEAFDEAAADAARQLDAPCDLCVVFAGRQCEKPPRSVRSLERREMFVVATTMRSRRSAL